VRRGGRVVREGSSLAEIDTCIIGRTSRGSTTPAELDDQPTISAVPANDNYRPSNNGNLTYL